MCLMQQLNNAALILINKLLVDLQLYRIVTVARVRKLSEENKFEATQAQVNSLLLSTNHCLYGHF